MTFTTDAMEPKRATMNYESEIRFGVVMYGGVSLAMYINGVANEMYEMVRATPKCKTEDKLTGTRELYRRLSWLLGNPSMQKEYSSRIQRRTKQPDDEAPEDVWTDELLKGQPPPTRLVVDVIAGTSAGGINGIFLAKALANGEQFSRLKDLWVTEGDIGVLLNDNRSYEGLDKCEQKSPPKSLLNGDRMYFKLHQVMEDMSRNSPANNTGPDWPPIDEMDLFVTTTDIQGSPVPLRLSDDVVYERRYKRSFHFKYSNEPNRCNDFAPNDENNALLAFAARCTSSFPFAFEPMTLDAAAKLVKPGCFDKVEKTSFFSQFSKAELRNRNHFSRAFGDGGYLDNKPFTYVAKTLSIRQAFVPVERILLYVEPAPQLVEAHESSSHDDGVPDALTNSLEALTSIPRYETIREDLQAILKRNRRIERIDRIVREGEIDLHRMLEGESNPFVHILREKGGEIPPFPDFNRKDMVTYFGTAFLSYRRMRVSSVTDKIAERLAELWSTDRASDHRYALTALVREWRDRHYQAEPQECGPHESTNQFFSTFDVGYRIRRLSFLLRQVDHLTRVIRKICTETTRHPTFAPTDEMFDLLPESDRWSIEHLEDGGLPLRNGKQDLASMERALAALSELKRELNEIQSKWRLAEYRRGAVAFDTPLEEDMLREQLNAVLSLLLGDKESNPVKLTTRSGGETTVQLPEQAVKALSSARTMRESVMIRARALHEIAKGSERTKLQDALEDGIRSMSLSKDVPNLWEKLGKPRLRLAANNTTLELDVETLKSDIMNSTEGKLISRVLGEYYVYFDLFDQMSFPLYNGSDIGEPCTVEVVRISPKDAKTLVKEEPGSRRKLAGTTLSNFGGFLDKRWRINDIMWGRLDGAERLIKALLPMSDASAVTIREELTELAHRTILRETIIPDGVGKLVDLLQNKTEGTTSSKSTVGRTHGLTMQTGSGQPLPHDQLKEMLSMLLNDQRLIDHVKRHDVDRTLDPKTTLENASRAITITGRVLEQIRTREGKKSFLFRWLVRSGLLFQGLVAVALPGSLKSLLSSHFLPVLYSFEILWLAFALPFGSAGVRNFAVTALVATGAAHVIILLLHDHMEPKARMRRFGLIVASLIILGLAAVGLVALATFHWREWLPG